MRFLIVVTLLLMSAPAYADGNFRHIIFGATPEDVMQFETAKYYKEEGGSLYFVEEKSKADFRVIRYDFQNGKFWRGRYEYQDLSDSDPMKILTRYEDLRLALEDDYGKIDEEMFTWKDKKYRNYPDFWGRALYSKDLKVRSVWELPGNTVTLEVFFIGPDYNLSYQAEQSGVAKKKEEGGLLSVPVVRPDIPAQP